MIYKSRVTSILFLVSENVTQNTLYALSNYTYDDYIIVGF